MDAKGVCTAHLYSPRSLPMIKKENLKFDPQFGLPKWSSQDQDLLGLDMTCSCSHESLASRGTMGKSYTAPTFETASLSEDNGAYQRCLGDIRDSWGPKADCDQMQCGEVP